MKASEADWRIVEDVRILSLAIILQAKKDLITPSQDLTEEDIRRTIRFFKNGRYEVCCKILDQFGCDKELLRKLMGYIRSCLLEWEARSRKEGAPPPAAKAASPDLGAQPQGCILKSFDNRRKIV